MQGIFGKKKSTLEKYMLLRLLYDYPKVSSPGDAFDLKICFPINVPISVPGSNAP